MRILAKRKLLDSSENEFENYKKRLICNFDENGNFSFYAKKVLSKSIKKLEINDEMEQRNEDNNKNQIKLRLDTSVSGLVKKLMKPDFIFERILNFHEKEYIFIFFNYFNYNLINYK